MFNKKLKEELRDARAFIDGLRVDLQLAENFNKSLLAKIPKIEKHIRFL